MSETFDTEGVTNAITESEGVTNDITESDRRLMELGYKPEFRREMSLFGVLGISFCAIGILTGSSAAFQTGLFSGGPLGLFWGWNVYALQDFVAASVPCLTRLGL
jgi:hypothetical protein